MARADTNGRRDKGRPSSIAVSAYASSTPLATAIVGRGRRRQRVPNASRQTRAVHEEPYEHMNRRWSVMLRVPMVHEDRRLVDDKQSQRRRQRKRQPRAAVRTGCRSSLRSPFCPSSGPRKPRAQTTVDVGRVLKHTFGLFICPRESLRPCRMLRRPTQRGSSCCQQEAIELRSRMAN
ncbi:hypothetical protein OH77DRAFT_1225544 [Trametes cingulata]|nr:hypothetical protein OH77DRAFT_1225544 [Trametes cingulata]